MKKRKEPERPLNERMAEALGLPGEVVCRLPEITLTGNRTLLVENHLGMMDYGECAICINTGIGVLKVTGANFDILSITDEVIALQGEIRSLSFEE